MSDINIDPSVLNERTDTYSSLTDINGADVFSNAYEEKVQQFQQEKQKVYHTVHNRIFVSGVGNGKDVYNQVIAELFTEVKPQVMKESAASESGGDALAIPMIGIAVVIIILLLARYVEKRRRKWTQDETDNYVYE